MPKNIFKKKLFLLWNIPFLVLSVTAGYYLSNNYFNFKYSRIEQNLVKGNNYIDKLVELISTERSLANDYLRGASNIKKVGQQFQRLDIGYYQLISDEYTKRETKNSLKEIYGSLVLVRNSVLSQSLSLIESDSQYSKILNRVNYLTVKKVDGVNMPESLEVLNQLKLIKYSINKLRDLMLVEFVNDMPVTDENISRIINLKTLVEIELKKGSQVWGKDLQVSMSLLMLSESWKYLNNAFIKLVKGSSSGHFQQSISEFDFYYQYLDKVLANSTVIQRSKLENISKRNEQSHRLWFLKTFSISLILLSIVWLSCHKIYRGVYASFLWSHKASLRQSSETVLEFKKSA